MEPSGKASQLPAVLHWPLPLAVQVDSGRTVIVPVVAYQVAAQALRAPLDRLKEWLQANNTAVMATLFLVIGVVLIGKGISVLA